MFDTTNVRPEVFEIKVLLICWVKNCCFLTMFRIYFGAVYNSVVLRMVWSAEENVRAFKRLRSKRNTLTWFTRHNSLESFNRILNIQNKYTLLKQNSLFSFEGQLCTYSWVLSLLGRFFYNIYIVKLFEIVFSFNVKDNNICPCLYNIRRSYNVEKCFSSLSIRMRIST